MTQLDAYYDDIPYGWLNTVKNLHYKLVNRDEHYSVVDCFERFGSMRVYLHNETPEVLGLISEVEIYTSMHCRECGSPAQYSYRDDNPKEDSTYCLRHLPEGWSYLGEDKYE